MTGKCAGWHRGFILQGDTLVASHSISTPLVVPRLLQHAENERSGEGQFAWMGQFTPQQSTCAGAWAAAKSTGTSLYHYYFCCYKHTPACVDAPSEVINWGTNASPYHTFSLRVPCTSLLRALHCYAYHCTLQSLYIANPGKKDWSRFPSVLTALD